MSKRYTRRDSIIYKVLILCRVNLYALLESSWGSQSSVWIIIQLKSEMPECMCRAVILT